MSAETSSTERTRPRKSSCPASHPDHAAGVLELKLETALRKVAHALDSHVRHELVAEPLHLMHDRLEDLSAVLGREPAVYDKVPRSE